MLTRAVPLLLTVSFTAVCGSVVAQSSAIIPSTAAIEGNGFMLLASEGQSLRRQIVIGGSDLLGHHGRRIRAIQIRRDGNVSQDATDEVTLSAMLRIGSAALAPASASDSFAANAPGAAVVFAGQVLLPATSATSGRTPTWSSPDAIEFPLSAPWLYTGGDLAIDLETSLSAPVWWPIDAHAETVFGMTSNLGDACGPFAAHWTTTLDVDTTGLVPGSTARFLHHGQTSAVALLGLGISTLSVPYDLGVIGAVGCRLHVDAIAWFHGSTSVPWTPDPAAGGFAHFPVRIPADAAFLGARFVAQAIDSGFAGVHASQALVCDIATAMPALAISTVEARGGAAASVMHGLTPRLRILWE